MTFLACTLNPRVGVEEVLVILVRLLRSLLHLAPQPGQTEIHPGPRSRT